MVSIRVESPVVSIVILVLSFNTVESVVCVSLVESLLQLATRSVAQIKIAGIIARRYFGWMSLNISLF